MSSSIITRKKLNKKFKFYLDTSEIYGREPEWNTITCAVSMKKYIFSFSCLKR